MSFDPLKQPLRGIHAIEASAGTGKTYSITLLWLRLLIQEGLRVDQVLVTTFTHAATAELQERLLTSLRRALSSARQEVGSDKGHEAQIVANIRPNLGERNLVRELETALSCFDLAPIHTLHGFCQSLINRHALELGCDPGMDLSEDAQEIIGEMVGDRLMLEADWGMMDPGDAAKVAKVVARNPNGRIDPPVTEDQVRQRSHALLDPLLQQIAQLPIKAQSRAPIIRKIESIRETGKEEEFSDAQNQALAPVLAELNAAMDQVRKLHRALAVARHHPVAGLVTEEFPKRKLAANIRTFDDILLTVHKALQGKGDDGPLAKAVRERFKAAIIDECQDSDGIQIDVFQKLFSKSHSFLVIGDPKQSIYRFRGADLGSYQRLAGEAAKAEEMTTNFRSDQPLVEALNRLYEPHPEFCGGTKDNPIRYIQVQASSAETRIKDPRLEMPVLLIWSPKPDRKAAKRHLAQQTAREYRRLLDDKVTIIDRETKKERPLKASDLAVLAFGHDDLALVRQELQKVSIPCQQAGRSLGNVWASDEALDVMSWLDAVHALEARSDPLAAMLSFMASPLIGLVATELENLRTAPAKQAEILLQLQKDRDALRYQGPLPLLQRYWMDPSRIGSRLGSRDGERRLTNWRQLGCLLQAEWASGRRRAGELSLWLARMRGQEDAEDGTLMKLETDLPAVQLVTIHTAKGLEYPVVCCPFLWHVMGQNFRQEAPVALVRRLEGAVIDIGSERFVENLQEAIKQEDEEQQRLLYVALTRGRHRLYVGLAPVASGGGRFNNGVEQSAFFKLLGIEKLDPNGKCMEDCPIPCLDIKPDIIVSPSGSVDDNKDADIQIGDASPISLRDGPLIPGRPTKPMTRCSSYSALTRHEEAAAKDYDPEDVADIRKDPGLLAGLGLGGNRLGTQVHTILENILGNGRGLDKVIDDKGPEWKTAIEKVLETPIPLGSGSVTLAAVQHRAIAEMHVLLPVCGITPGKLSQALLCDPLISADAARRSWAEDIARWSFKALHGFFQGYIDLIFEQDGMWHIVDYKTNTLHGYDRDSLEKAMLEHHYVLQSRLYTVALHRHLRATMREQYDPGKHLGGCAYLFLRGFPKQGVWFERARLEAINALDDLFAKAQP